MDWIWQNLFSSALWEVVLVLGGAALFGFIKQKVPQYAPTIGYAALGAICVAILLYTLTGRAILSKRVPQVTTENLETTIRQWADEAGMGTAKLPAQSEMEELLLSIVKFNNVFGTVAAE